VKRLVRTGSAKEGRTTSNKNILFGVNTVAAYMMSVSDTLSLDTTTSGIRYALKHCQTPVMPEFCEAGAGEICRVGMLDSAAQELV
jgi:hypothetical protein